MDQEMINREEFRYVVSVIYWHLGYSKCISADGILEFQDRRTESWKCADPEIFAVLYDKAGISASDQNYECEIWIAVNEKTK